MERVNDLDLTEAQIEGLVGKLVRMEFGENHRIEVSRAGIVTSVDLYRGTIHFTNIDGSQQSLYMRGRRGTSNNLLISTLE